MTRIQRHEELLEAWRLKGRRRSVGQRSKKILMRIERDSSVWCTPLKINMEPENHLFEEESHPQNFFVSMLIFRHFRPTTQSKRYSIFSSSSWKKGASMTIDSFYDGNAFGCKSTTYRTERINQTAVNFLRCFVTIETWSRDFIVEHVQTRGTILYFKTLRSRILFDAPGLLWGLGFFECLLTKRHLSVFPNA